MTALAPKTCHSDSSWKGARESIATNSICMYVQTRSNGKDEEQSGKKIIPWPKTGVRSKVGVPSPSTPYVAARSKHGYANKYPSPKSVMPPIPLTPTSPRDTSSDTDNDLQTVAVPTEPASEILSSSSDSDWVLDPLESEQKPNMASKMLGYSSKELAIEIVSRCTIRALILKQEHHDSMRRVQ